METNVMDDYTKQKFEELKQQYGQQAVNQVCRILENGSVTTKDEMLQIFLKSDCWTQGDKDAVEQIMRIKVPTKKVIRSQVYQGILEGIEISGNIIDTCETAEQLFLAYKNHTEMNHLRQQIAELETKGNLTKDEKKILESLKMQLNNNLVAGAEMGLKAISDVASHVPVIGNYVSAQVSLGIDLMKKGASMLEEHNRQMQELIDWMNGQDEGSIKDSDLWARVPKNSEIAKYYEEYQMLQESGIMDLLLKNEEDKRNYKSNAAAFRSEWTKLQNNINEVNSKLSAIARYKEKDKVNNIPFYKYNLEHGLKKVKDAQGDVTRPYDPLVVDLNHNGFDLHPVENGVHFDLDANGTKEKTSWVDKQDGFLVLD